MSFPSFFSFPPSSSSRRGILLLGRGVLWIVPLFFVLSGFLSAEEPRGRRVIRIREATRVIGEIQRPQVTYILNRSQRVQMSLDPSLERIRPSFLGEFRGVVERNPDLFLPRSER
jgi:hypothetical protein